MNAGNEASTDSKWTRLVRRSKQQRYFRSFVTPPDAALGLLPLGPRAKQAILPPNTRSDWL